MWLLVTRSLGEKLRVSGRVESKVQRAEKSTREEQIDNIRVGQSAGGCKLAGTVVRSGMVRLGMPTALWECELYLLSYPVNLIASMLTTTVLALPQ